MSEGLEPIQEHVPAPKRETRNRPTPEFRFFLYDPEANGFTFYKSAAERDADAKWNILGYLDEDWSEEVTGIIAGELTHHAVMCDVLTRPKREEFASDGEFEDAMSAYGISADYSYKCNYKLAPLDEEGEPEPAV